MPLILDTWKYMCSAIIQCFVTLCWNGSTMAEKFKKHAIIKFSMELGKFTTKTLEMFLVNIVQVEHRFLSGNVHFHAYHVLVQNGKCLREPISNEMQENVDSSRMTITEQAISNHQPSDPHGKPEHASKVLQSVSPSTLHSMIHGRGTEMFTRPNSNNVLNNVCNICF